MSSVEEITAALERQLADASAKIDEFVTQQSASLQKAAADHESLMRQMEGKVSKLQNDEERAAQRLAEMHATLESEKRALGERKADMLTLKVQSQSLPVEVDAMRAAETEARSQLDASKQEFDRREAEVRFQLHELTRGVSYYKRLGLEFEKIHDDRLRLVFTQVDALDPTRKFAFNVRVADEDASYSVDGVEPPVAGLEALVAQLNATNDFSVFVQLMRRKFVDAAAAARGGGAAARARA